VHTLAPECKKGLIFGGKSTLLREQLAETGATILSIPYLYLTRDFVSEMAAEGYTVVAWTVDEPSHIQRMMDMHPALHICTNHPDRMLDIKKKI
ncbi:glycerophosphodiester phosphodiesterase, partial [Acinetobacter baumannii]|uniref:glycerophosphodiester phosphodiesterase n=1 Tax=Acinetobacter baumannii TaxID=470 RepID=UPI000A956ECA